MVIHTIIDEYDLMYAQEREMNFVLYNSADKDEKFSTALSANLTALTCQGF